MILFIWILVVGFSYVGKALRSSRSEPFERRIMIWTLGVILFGHATTFMSVNYFDQSFVFFLLALAGIGSLPVESRQLQRAAIAESKSYGLGSANYLSGVPRV